MRAPAVLLAAAAACAVAAAPASGSVRVDFRVTDDPGAGTQVEFSPDRGSFVALYGAFSDGSLRAIFPGPPGTSHWVEAHERRTVRVDAPDGARLEQVRVVASDRWFDPVHVWTVGGPPAVQDVTGTATGTERRT